MDAARFDAVARALAARRSRRGVVGGAAAGLAGLALGLAAAQDAPPTSPAAGGGEDPTFLFVQTFAGGAFAQNPGAGTPVAGGAPTLGGGASYLLTLDGHHGGTVYFSDRPARIFGEAPTQAFLDGLGFSPANPPNAALVAQTETGDEIVVLELVEPAYDAGAGTLTYGAEVLAEYAGEGLAHVAAQQADQELPELFGRASLFIDECQAIEWCALCTEPYRCFRIGPIPGGPYGKCWDWSALSCKPCRDYGDLAALCNATYPAFCDVRCRPL